LVFIRVADSVCLHDVAWIVVQTIITAIDLCVDRGVELHLFLVLDASWNVSVLYYLFVFFLLKVQLLGLVRVDKRYIFPESLNSSSVLKRS